MFPRPLPKTRYGCCALPRFYARYAHLGFQVAESTLAFTRSMAASGELTTLTPERVFAETRKALNTRSPGAYFQLLGEVGAFADVFPGWRGALAVALTHLDEVSHQSEDPAVRLAAFLYHWGDCDGLLKRLATPSQWRRLHQLSVRLGSSLVALPRGSGPSAGCFDPVRCPASGRPVPGLYRRRWSGPTSAVLVRGAGAGQGRARRTDY